MRTHLLEFYVLRAVERVFYGENIITLLYMRSHTGHRLQPEGLVMIGNTEWPKSRLTVL